MPTAPTCAGLAESHGRAARRVAQRLAAAGHRGWIVGGAVRDLALGRTPKDVDMVSAATPDEVERIFEHTLGVGRAFGILCVQVEGESIELATFRSEAGYTDGRRPDRVFYGTSLAEDAARRDFTCNALYLDPLTDEVADPFGGVADLERGQLATVGTASERFAEDGLRLLRMARFEASLDLSPAPGLHAAARASAAALRGVSPERVLEELSRMLSGPRALRAIRTLQECELLERALPAWAAALPPGGDLPELRLAALGELGDPPGVGPGLAVLLDPDPRAAAVGETAGEQALALRASRALTRELEQLFELRRKLPALAHEGVDRAARLRVLREPHGPNALRVALAFARAGLGESAPLERLRDRLAALDPAELRPTPLLRSSDLVAAGLEPGPDFGKLLREAEDEQLRGALASRAQALQWLERRLAGREDSP